MILTHTPTACEGSTAGSWTLSATDPRSGGGAAVAARRQQVLVELVGDDQGQLQARAERLLAEAGALDGRVVGDPVQSLALWKIREDGAGLAGVSLSRPAYPGWEDAAVPTSLAGCLPPRLRQAVG